MPDRGAPEARLWPLLADGEKSLARSIPSQARRRHFALGRLAAREAIRGVVRISACDREAEILRGERGEPVVHGDEDVRVSVSHTKGLAAACAWRKTGWSAGIDIERIRPTDILDSAHAFSRREQELLGRTGPPALALVGWVAKEAAWKAFILDPRDGPEAVEIEDLDEATGRATVRAAGCARSRPLARARFGRVRVGGHDYAWALAWTRRATQNW